MAIGERIKLFRNLHDMTQKCLGIKIGFSESTSEVGMAQYENGAKTPKEKMVADFANMWNVSLHALIVPDINTKHLA
ncbi:MAG: helix-turn-helix domain-containing protein [Lentihominibacter sp.]|jgi:transcriptional regulator with XRE-family HTH domain